MLSGPDLDELAESLLSDEVVAVFPLAWISAQWLERGTADGTTRTVQVSDEAVARDERRVEPPMRRWAAARALRNDPARDRRAIAEHVRRWLTVRGNSSLPPRWPHPNPASVSLHLGSPEPGLGVNRNPQPPQAGTGQRSPTG